MLVPSREIVPGIHPNGIIPLDGTINPQMIYCETQPVLSGQGFSNFFSFSSDPDFGSPLDGDEGITNLSSVEMPLIRQAVSVERRHR